MNDEYRCCHGTPKSGHSRSCPYDKRFWGPEGVRVLQWGGTCAMGLQYRDNGITTDGQKNARRTFSGGRKARGMASDGLK